MAAGARHIYHQYTVRVEGDRDGALAQLKEAGVGSAVYYPTPIHRLVPYAHVDVDLPVTDRAAAEVLSIPVHPSLSRRRHRPRHRRGEHIGAPAVTEQLRAGLIGMGAMGRNHARVLNSLEGVELVAVADPMASARPCRSGVQLVQEVEQLIALGIDYAVVACPTIIHEPIGLALAEAGVHALIEKPLANTAEASNRLAAAFESRGLVAGVGHIERFNPAMRLSARAPRSGRAGGDPPGRDPPPGPVPGPHRRRRGRQGPRHARHRPHGLRDRPDLPEIGAQRSRARAASTRT